MKRIVLLLALAAGTIMANAQGVAIGAGNPTPDPSALLDLQSTTQGLLPPRMTTAQRTAIAAPATGLVVYDTTVGALFLRTTSAWVQLSTGIPSWSLVGNSGIDPATNFIGTTDGQPLQFRVSNLTAGTVNLTMRNTSLGAFSLAAGGTGNWNAAFGYEALRFNLEGAYNCAFGARALRANTTGYDNVASGVEAMRFNTTGYRNTAVGSASLYTNTEGHHNTAIGHWALFSTTTGYQNTAIGDGAMFASTSSLRNVAIGNGAMGQSNNVADNVAVGDSALYNTSTVLGSGGWRNVAVGPRALYNNTAGVNNTAVGFVALGSATSHYNTALGSYALAGLESGGSNTACGNNALQSLNSGYNNSALGSGSGVVGDFSGTTAIGHGAIPTADERINIGTSANNNLVGVFGAVQNLSDARFKFDVVEDVPGLAFISKLRPVTYHLDAAKVDAFTGVRTKMDSSTDPEELERYAARVQEVSAEKLTGFVAQEVEQAAKELGYDFDGVQHPKNDGDTYTLGYSTFVVPLVKAVQEQQAMIEQQQTTIAAQQQAIEILQAQVHQLIQP